MHASYFDEITTISYSYLTQVDGGIMMFDDTLPKLMIYKDKPKKTIPCKVDMDLFDIKIPVALYLKVGKTRQYND